MRGYRDITRSTTSVVHFIEADKVNDELFDLKIEIESMGTLIAYTDSTPPAVYDFLIKRLGAKNVFVFKEP